jgi:hypothetical protein
MKNEVYFGVAIRIIILFVCGMLLTFIPNELRGFFGDVECIGCYPTDVIDTNWTWGARHYWYYWMMFFLFLLSLVSVIMQSANLIGKHYNK